METFVRTPQAIFFHPQLFVVPPFQRPYVWDKEEQWEPLWQDIRRLAEGILGNRFSAPNHFLGAVVIQALDPVPGSLQASSIIDGQQRLTTLQLLCDATEGILDQSGFDALAARLDMLTHNQAMFVPEGEPRLKLRHTNKDRDAFIEVMSAVPPIDYETLMHSGSLIVNAHAFFRETVEAWLGDPGDAGFTARAEALVQSITHGLQLVAINLGAQENSQEIFETLNARGTPLTAADLIKNFVFQRLDNEGADTKVVYSQDWPFESKFWEAEVSVGRHPMTRSSLFFNQWLVATLAEEVSPKATFTRFKSFVELETGQKMLDLLRSIKQQADLYQSWTEAAEDPDKQLSRVEMAMYRMKASETELLKPLLIWLHGPERDVAPNQMEELVAVAESWVMRRQLLRLTGADLGRIVVELIRQLGLASPDEFAQRASSYLSGLSSLGTYWPGDREIQQALRTERAYRRFPRPRLRLFLEAIENTYRAETNQPLVPRRGYPIEHILPRGWNEHWKVEGAEAEEKRAAHVHRLGNLTLLTSSLNSKVSNRPWAEKRTRLKDHDTLLMNSRLLAATSGVEWDESKIDLRTESMVGVLLQIWPVPDGHEGTVLDAQEKSQNWIQLSHLLAAGLLSAGTVLTPRKKEFASRTATILADGRIEMEGQIFDSPSGACMSITQRSTNGWYFWLLPDGRRLMDARAEFRGSAGG